MVLQTSVKLPLRVAEAEAIDEAAPVVAVPIVLIPPPLTFTLILEAPPPPMLMVLLLLPVAVGVNFT